MNDSNIEKIATIASTFLGATIEVQWDNACGRSMSYIEKGRVDGFVIHWLGGDDSVIVFYVTDYCRELHYLRSEKIERLEIDESIDMEDTSFSFPISAIECVWNVDETTQLRILRMAEIHDDLTGPMRIVLSKD